MASQRTPFTVTYRKVGTEPPVYLAGSFSEPSWQPQEMQAARGSDGEYLFSSDLEVVAGHEYEIKFKIGDGNWWVYDEEKPVVTDCDGNENNILAIPLPHSDTAERRASTGKVLNEYGLRDTGCHPTRKEFLELVDKSAKTQDKKPIYENGSNHFPADNTDSEYTWQKQEPLKTPLFAHECLGAYEFVADDRMDNVDALELEHRRQSRKLSRDYSVDEVDVNDPSIEKFPSDRSSVLDSLRKIQTSLPADQAAVDEAPTFSSIEFRRSSVDSADDSAVSTGSMSPTTPTSHRMRDNRPSYSSFGKTKSTVSLTSIAEEPKAGDPSSPRTPGSALLKPEDGHSPPRTRSPPSDGDAALTMKGYKARHKMQSGRSSQFPVDELPVDCTRSFGPSHEIA